MSKAAVSALFANVRLVIHASVGTATGYIISSQIFIVALLGFCITCMLCYACFYSVEGRVRSEWIVYESADFTIRSVFWLFQKQMCFCCYRFNEFDRSGNFELEQARSCGV